MWQSLFRDLYSSLESQATSPVERLVLGMHLCNVSKGLHCTGLQEEDPESDQMLPEAWNRNTQVYSFKYKHSTGFEVFFKVVKITGNAVSIHCLRSDKSGTILTWKVPVSMLEELEKTPSDSIEDFLLSSVLPVYHAEIIEKTLTPPKAKSSLLIEERGPPNPIPGVPFNPYVTPYFDPSGASDLYPGAPMMGGGLLGPQHPMFQQGTRKPPFRIDPLGPFPGMGPNNPDHFQPPGGFGGFGGFGI